MQNVHVFTGENSFELLKEKTRWISEFAKKYGEENITVVQSATTPLRTLFDEVSVLPFLAEKRLVVVEGIPKTTKEEIELFEQCVHPSSVVLFIESKPDKRLVGVKELMKKANSRVFEPLKGAPLVSWVHTYAAQQTITLDSFAVETLMEYTGDDQSMLSQEILKLAAFAPHTAITKKEIEALSVPTEEGVVWKISDLLAAGRKQEALLFAHRLIDRGGDAYGLWAILTSMFKNLVFVFAATESGIHSSEQIAEETGIHPFALRSLLQYCKRLHRPEVFSFLQWTASTERALKTGELRATNEAPQEINAVIDAFILQCP